MEWWSSALEWFVMGFTALLLIAGSLLTGAQIVWGIKKAIKLIKRS